jgi:cholestenol Delta-isomerase
MFETDHPRWLPALLLRRSIPIPKNTFSDLPLTPPGYFVYNHATLAGSQSIFGQAWKEYTLSDSRYLTSDPFMLCVEAITVAVWGPLCWAIVAAIAARSPLRHPLQIVMCVGHLYGVALYYSTSLTERAMTGTMHSRPEFLYFWVYYVGFNAPWVVVPGGKSS